MIGLRLIGRQMFPGGDISLMVKVEMLATGQSPPWDQLFNIEAVGRIGPPIGHQAAPDRAVK